MAKRAQSRRDAITRTWFFLGQARSCPYGPDSAAREPFEAYLEAVIIHLRSVERIVIDAEERFGTATLFGLWED
jgi:hypothetical protein